MVTKASLQDSLRDAMRNGDDLRKRTLRLALSSIRLAEIDQGEELDENRLISILQKEIKAREETIESAKISGRMDLVETAKAELEVLEEFLPEQLSEYEIVKMAQKAISEAQASSPADMGKVMKLLLPRIAGRASGGQVSQIVKKMLNE